MSVDPAVVTTLIGAALGFGASAFQSWQQGRQAVAAEIRHNSVDETRRIEDRAAANIDKTYEDRKQVYATCLRHWDQVTRAFSEYDADFQNGPPPQPEDIWKDVTRNLVMLDFYGSDAARDLGRRFAEALAEWVDNQWPQQRAEYPENLREQFILEVRRDLRTPL